MTLVATQLLNDDGSASMATAFMMSHHGFRRDIALFKRALAHSGGIDGAPRIEALQEEWKAFHAKLHGHHQVEDNGVFPGIREQHAELGTVIAELVADHQRLDPMLEAGERAFAKLPATAEAAAIVAEMSALLDKHLGLEEQKIVPLLRGANTFPSPASDAEAEMYAEGFAWACQGIAPQVLDAGRQDVARVGHVAAPRRAHRVHAQVRGAVGHRRWRRVHDRRARLAAVTREKTFAAVSIRAWLDCRLGNKEDP